MNAILFLSVDEVVGFHRDLLEAFGGQDGTRDLGLLESALAQPSQSFGGQYLHEDLAAMAAAYLYHIVRNHPFLDGNKRTGAHSALAFLALNGQEVDLDVDEAEQLVLGVAEGRTPKDQVAEFFRQKIGIP